MHHDNRIIRIAVALLCTYFIWGSTYLAIRFGIESFPPFLMAAMRFTTAGLILYIVMRYLGTPNPNKQQWLGAGIVGLLLPALGNGTVCYVSQTVSSSVVALAIATVPIWMAIFTSIWGHKITRQEWLGIAIGFVGIALLNLGGSLQGDMTSAMLLIFAAASWSFGSVFSQFFHNSRLLDIPSKLMAVAYQMLVGGVILLIASTYFDETFPEHVSAKSWGAMAFLVILASLITYSAYQWLLSNVRPLVASSNAFVNPVVALVVGVVFANEQVRLNEYLASVLILLGVLLVFTAHRKVQSQI